jgi:hypothetical protein
MYDHTQWAATIHHGTSIYTLWHSLTTPLLATGGNACTMQLLLGPKWLDTTSRSLQVTRSLLAGIRSPCGLVCPRKRVARITPGSHGQGVVVRLWC